MLTHRQKNAALGLNMRHKNVPEPVKPRKLNKAADFPAEAYTYGLKTCYSIVAVSVQHSRSKPESQYQYSVHCIKGIRLICSQRKNHLAVKCRRNLDVDGIRHSHSLLNIRLHMHIGVKHIKLVYRRHLKSHVVVSEPAVPGIIYACKHGFKGIFAYKNSHRPAASKP